MMIGLKLAVQITQSTQMGELVSVFREQRTARENQFPATAAGFNRWSSLSAEYCVSEESIHELRKETLSQAKIYSATDVLTEILLLVVDEEEEFSCPPRDPEALIFMEKIVLMNFLVIMMLYLNPDRTVLYP
ncbi:unnamed protein product [Ilex paraguariensis]|uniref:Uncharacterized protein n=1 Tax=Ilex paraguariensis TaxID=185542 RepID=A0ABC8U8Z4_9AQUA